MLARSFFFVLLSISFSAHAQDQKYFPLDFGGLHYARDYGVKCDGSDETIKIQQGVKDAMSNLELGGKHYLVLPPGDCVANDQIAFKDNLGKWEQQLILSGSGRNRTRLHLAANSPGFGTSATPKAFIYTASKFEGVTGENPAWEATGAGNKAFFEMIRDMTVIIEPGNIGATAIDLLVSNVGGVRNVDLQAAGATATAGPLAIGTQRYGPGPGIIEDVTITGFRDQVSFSSPEYDMVLNNVTFTAWNRYAVSTLGTALALRNITASANRKVFINQASNSQLVTIVDGSISNTNISPFGFAFQGPGQLFARNITQINPALGINGYTAIIQDKQGVIVPGTKVKEYTSASVLSAFADDPKKSLNLPVPPTPTPFWSDEPIDWVNVASFVTDPNSPIEDWDAAIRTAFSKCKSMVYFPSDKMVRRSPMQPSIPIPACVKTIVGFNATWRPPQGTVLDPNAIQPTFEVLATPADNSPLSLLMIVGRSGGFTGFRQNSQRTIVVQDSAIGTPILEVNTAPVFVSDVVAQPIVKSGAQLYAAQLNMESLGIDLDVQTGGTAVVLGIKTELPSIVARVQADAQLEVLGGLLYPGQLFASPQSDYPAFDVLDGKFFGSFIESAYLTSARAYSSLTQESRSGIVSTVLGTSAVARPSTFGRLVPGLSAQGRPGCATP